MSAAGGPEKARVDVRPTAFGIWLSALVVAAIVARPAVADPSVMGLVWAGLAGVVVFGVVWPLVTARTLRVEVLDAPTDLVVGQLGTLEVGLRGRASGVSIACTGQPLVVLDVVSPGVVRVPFTIAGRGAFRRIRLDVGNDAPFGIVSVTRTRLVDLPRPLLVAPAAPPSDAPTGPLPGDESQTRPVGAGLRGDAVRSVRPYASGDPSHLVHWPSSARVGTLVVRELEPPAADGVAIVVDLTPPPAQADTDPVGAQDAVDSAAQRAMGLAEGALERGARVVLCTVEAHGPVSAEVGDVLGARRRLALAVAGTPEPPAPDWPSVDVRAEPVALSASRSASQDLTPGSAAAWESRGSKRRRPKVSPDRRTVGPARMLALTVLVGLQLYAALSALPQSARDVAAYVGMLCALLAMFGLRSIPIRWIVRGLAVLSGVVMARFGELGALEGATGSWAVLLWLGATAAALALAPSSRAVPGVTGAVVVNAADLAAPRGSTSPRDSSGSARAPVRGSVPAAIVVAAVALVGASALLGGPRASTLFPIGASAGDDVDLGDGRGGSPLSGGESLSMTSRPRLSDRPVMSVRSPVAALWRTSVYDRWDGTTWRRADPSAHLLVEDGRVVPAAEDIAAVEGEPIVQEFRIEANGATVLPAAASPVWIDLGSVVVVQRPEGTLSSPIDPLGAGAAYRVESRQVPLDATALRAASGSVPADVAARYAGSPVTTDRVAELARSLTAGIDDDYDRLRALTDWMGEHTRYSLEAPLSPPGVDVVDHFLFDEQLGWCEQIATSFVVMARSIGTPARLATGFASGEWDAAGGRFVVREHDAHAWAEVWFPELGWVTFDPTASVPIAGAADATAGAAARDWREIAGGALVALGVVALCAGWLGRVARRWVAAGRRKAAHRRAVRRRWDVAEEERIERAGAAAGRPRGPGETITSYGAVVAEATGDPSVVERAEQIDRIRYRTAP